MAALSGTETTTYRVTITRSGADGATTQTARELGITALERCTTDALYYLQGALTDAHVAQLAHQVLTDPVNERAEVTVFRAPEPAPGTVEVVFLPGVTDSVAENLVAVAHRAGFRCVERAASGRRYRLSGALTAAEVQRLAYRVLANPILQRVAIDSTIAPPFVEPRATDATVETIALCDAADDALATMSNERRLALNLAEMRAIRGYCRDRGRDPTDVELEMLAQTWSEHCVHKTFRAKIRYHGPPPGVTEPGQEREQTIDGLLATYIRGATERIAKPWVESAFVDNAGIVAFDDRWSVAFKVETHNHPAALEPFGGANTGVGGVVRDILGVSARPIANTDVLCFGPPDLDPAEVPDNVLHPRRIASGVVHGIEDYGNKMGIPTVNGAIVYDRGYTANPLVFCGCLGILPRGSHPTEPRAGDLIVVIGGRTGRDGLRGATFSSMGMDRASGDLSGSAVQIGHPIHEKQVQEVIVRARDARLYTALTDCGAGGLSSAIGEMAGGIGAVVQLADVPLKYPGLQPWEIWLSEAQERMVLAVDPTKWEQLAAVCAGQDVEAVVVGRCTATGRVTLHYHDTVVGDLELAFLHHGLPRGHLTATWRPPRPAVHKPPVTPDATRALLQLLADDDIRSKESVIRRYDHEVQGATAIKPLIGRRNHGPSDAAVLIPQEVQRDSRRGVGVSVGLCPAIGRIDPYAMAWAAIDEALRNLVATGADPDRIAILDNFCWGNPNLPDRLGSLVRCAQGCYDAAVAYGTPFISGKDSLHNEYAATDGTTHAIPGTLVISAVGIVPRVEHTATPDLKRADNRLYVVGATGDHIAGGHFARRYGQTADTAPPEPVESALDHLRALHRAMLQGLVAACHDCSDGGLAVALAEMCIAGELGATVDLTGLPGTATCATQRLFAESLTRFVVEVATEDAAAFERVIDGVPHAAIGTVSAEPVLSISAGDAPIAVPVAELERAWRGALAPRGRYHGAPDRQPSVAQRPRQPKLRATTTVGSPAVLVLHANGTNRDRDAALACELAGGTVEIVHLNRLLAGERDLLDYAMLVIPGGFSYGDDLGAGSIWALDLRLRLRAALDRFIADGRPVLGICNGFQALVKARLLPGESGGVTLTANESERFECRWVYLEPNPNSPCVFTQGLTEPISCPVAHGEGRLVTGDRAALDAITARELHALTYVTPDRARGGYPHNPNGSDLAIAGLCNPAGNVLGLMPHPENHIFAWQHPRRRHGERAGSGLTLFQNGLRRC